MEHIELYVRSITRKTIMFNNILITLLGGVIMLYAANLPGADSPAPLSPQERYVIIDKGTEPPFVGKFDSFFQPGLYRCRQCGAPLYRSDDKFKSGCGWPAFDDAFDGAIKQTRDSDGSRVEITCAKCGGHLGHVFTGERLTPKDTRHCVNSLSMTFVPAESGDFGRAVLGGGCFWGVEYYLRQIPGVLYTTVGYSGGKTSYPVYEQVCAGNTGHVEVVEVIFDPRKTGYETIVRTFLEVHDPTQLNRQGPDVGQQYRSVIFYYNDVQRKTAENLLQQLRDKGFKVTTELLPAARFYPAEDYHRHYYEKKGTLPYCHARVKRF